mgnify:CR=1 FL=1
MMPEAEEAAKFYVSLFDDAAEWLRRALSQRTEPFGTGYLHWLAKVAEDAKRLTPQAPGK